jgi:hypothetical protein
MHLPMVIGIITYRTGLHPTPQSVSDIEFYLQSWKGSLTIAGISVGGLAIGVLAVGAIVIGQFDFGSLNFEQYYQLFKHYIRLVG